MAVMYTQVHISFLDSQIGRMPSGFECGPSRRGMFSPLGARDRVAPKLPSPHVLFAAHPVRFYDRVHIAYISPDRISRVGGEGTREAAVGPTGRRRAYPACATAPRIGECLSLRRFLPFGSPTCGSGDPDHPP